MTSNQEILRTALREARQVIVTACGTKAPYARIAVENIDAALQTSWQPDQTQPPRAKDQPGPWWTPTAEVERLMRWCKDANTITVEISTKVLEGLLYDSLLWRKDRAAQPIKPDETTENVAADTYWAISEVLKTESGWSVLEHVGWMRELMAEASEVLHDIGEDQVRVLCAKVRACLKGEAPNGRWPEMVNPPGESQ